MSGGLPFDAKAETLGKMKQLGQNNRETYTFELINIPGLYQ
jgi:hypothetical protein